MIQWDWEDRLHERLDARKLIRELPPRERRIFCARLIEGRFGEELAAEEGCSAARIAQITYRALRRLQQRSVSRETLKPEADTPRQTAPNGFDRAAFLAHMRGLIARREHEKQRIFERERMSLDAMLGDDDDITPSADLPYEPTPLPPLIKLWQPPNPLKFHHVPASDQQPQEPWYDPAKVPTPAGMMEIARYALDYLRAILGILPVATTEPGPRLAHVICDRHPDAIAHAMQALRQHLPSGIRFSQVPPVIPDGLLGAAVDSQWLSLTVISLYEGRNLSIEVGFT